MPWSPMELRCSYELAHRLGAITPMNFAELRHLKSQGHLLIRAEMGVALFWPWAEGIAFRAVSITPRSS